MANHRNALLLLLVRQMLNELIKYFLLISSKLPNNNAEKNRLLMTVFLKKGMAAIKHVINPSVVMGYKYPPIQVPIFDIKKNNTEENKQFNNK